MLSDEALMPLHANKKNVALKYLSLAKLKFQFKPQISFF
jgi:hypothetical protein